jgi:hypothetical protein
MSQEVQDLNRTFDDTIKHIEYGIELGRQAGQRKMALNNEFSVFLDVIEEEGLPTRSADAKFRPEKRVETCEPQVQRIPQVIVDPDRRRADLLHWQKAGLLDDEEQ